MEKPLSKIITPTSAFSETALTFIKQHLHDDVNQLILKFSHVKELDIKKLAGQILSRQKALKKLPEWSSHAHLIFPPALSVEQSSSEATARYKASLVSGDSLVDITGGMGVDCCYMSPNFHRTDYYEQQEEVAQTAAYNFNVLGLKNIHVYCNDSLQALQTNQSEIDWIYADPARRDNNKEKVVRLSDCTPDVVSNLDILMRKAPNILIKTSPLLDIDLAVKELRNVKEVHITGYEQEWKELLFSIERNYNEEIQIKVRILSASGIPVQLLNFTRTTERDAEIRFSNPLSFLYEPHAAILKAGAFKTVATTFDISKIAPSSHLYTSQNMVQDFPGRTFQIIGNCKPDISEILKFIKDSKANLTLRNFPAKIDDLRKKWRLKDGGDFYLFATTLQDHKKTVIVTKKISVL